jgi:hypothetical protein
MTRLGSISFVGALLWPALACGVLLSSCTQYDGGTTALTVPPRGGFEPVSAVLEAHCGTLDCHGGPARNLRVYGVNGLRASGDAVTGNPDTTEQDIDATYEALIGVEPEALSAVAADHGKAPARWLVVRKARGSEEHTGGEPLPEGSAGDRCLVSWVSGTVDDAACTEDVFGPVPKEGEEW